MGRKYTDGESSRLPLAEPPKIFNKLGLFSPASLAFPCGRNLGLAEPPVMESNGTFVSGPVSVADVSTSRSTHLLSS